MIWNKKWTGMSENAVSKSIYIEASKLMEATAKRISFRLVKFTFPLTILPMFFLTVYNYFTSETGTNSYVLPFRTMWEDSTNFNETVSSHSKNQKHSNIQWISCFRLPFSLNTPLGYLVTFFAQSIGAYYLVVICTPIVSFYFASCQMLAAFARDITNDLSRLHVDRGIKLKRDLGDVVCIYSEVKE